MATRRRNSGPVINAVRGYVSVVLSVVLVSAVAGTLVLGRGEAWMVGIVWVIFRFLSRGIDGRFD
jgi:hypothetical protein